MYMKFFDYFKKIINFFNSLFLVLFEMVIIVNEMFVQIVKNEVNVFVLKNLVEMLYIFVVDMIMKKKYLNVSIVV